MSRGLLVAPAEKLRVLRDEKIGDCKRCGLCEKRTKIVFGNGDPQARIFFVGEGPGADEDAHGDPFVGRAGQLLDQMILAMGLLRSEVYVGNTVKCRPPYNRAPKPGEMAACAPFLREQIEIVRPKVVVALGRIAANWFFDCQSIIAERGKWRAWSHRNSSYALMPTFHPAFLLRDARYKKFAWRDLKSVMRYLDTGEGGP